MTGAAAVRGRVVYGITAGVSAATLLRGQLAWLRHQGWQVTLAVDPDERALAAAEREGVALAALPMRREIAPLADLRALLSWVRLLRRGRPEAVNVSTPKAGLLGGVAAALLRIPRRVYVLRGLRVEGSRGPRAALLWLAERLSIAAATDVVVVSASLAAEARRRGLLPHRGAWLVGEGSSNGVQAATIARRCAAVDAAALRARLGLRPDDVVVGYVGRLTADKGLATLLDAVDPLPAAVRLLLIGSLEEAPLRAAIAEAGDRCVHVGWTDDVWSFYAVMDVLALPTRREGFPNVVLEAAAAGVPTVTTTATGAVDSVVPGRTGLIVPVDDAAALGAALLDLAASPSRRREFGEAARLRAEGDYAPETIWRGIDSILRGEPNDAVTRL